MPHRSPASSSRMMRFDLGINLGEMRLHSFAHCTEAKIKGGGGGVNAYFLFHHARSHYLSNALFDQLWVSVINTLDALAAASVLHCVRLMCVYMCYCTAEKRRRVELSCHLSPGSLLRIRLRDDTLRATEAAPLFLITELRK